MSNIDWDHYLVDLIKSFAQFAVAIYMYIEYHSFFNWVWLVSLFIIVNGLFDFIVALVRLKKGRESE